YPSTTLFGSEFGVPKAISTGGGSRHVAICRKQHVVGRPECPQLIVVKAPAHCTGYHDLLPFPPEGEIECKGVEAGLDVLWCFTSCRLVQLKDVVAVDPCQVMGRRLKRQQICSRATLRQISELACTHVLDGYVPGTGGDGQESVVFGKGQ